MIRAWTTAEIAAMSAGQALALLGPGPLRIGADGLPDIAAPRVTTDPAELAAIADARERAVDYKAFMAADAAYLGLP